MSANQSSEFGSSSPYETQLYNKPLYFFDYCYIRWLAFGSPANWSNKQIDVSFSFVFPVVDHEFLPNIVKETADCTLSKVFMSQIILSNHQ